MPLLGDSKSVYVGTTPITKVMAAGVQVWPNNEALVSGKPYPTRAIYYPEPGAGLNAWRTYFYYDVPDLKLFAPNDYPGTLEPNVGDFIRFPVHPTLVNQYPSGDEIPTEGSIRYDGKRLEYGKTVYSYMSKARSYSYNPPPDLKFDYTITINGVTSDPTEADLHVSG